MLIVRRRIRIQVTMRRSWCPSLISRHVSIPKQLVKYVPTDRLMPEDEWRGLGVKQSQGWEHYMIHSKYLE